MHWTAVAPSNIALIKYMGKQSIAGNQPINASLSYTLPHLSTRVELTLHDEDVWIPIRHPDVVTPELSQQGIDRFLAHLKKIKHMFNCDASFIVSSGNNFPHGAGLASSASSFAALTQCALRACADLTDRPLPSLPSQAAISQTGSGSSCRSFFSPWVLWNDQGVHPLVFPQMHLIHQVILFDNKEKKVSSSQAHERIKSSPLYSSRPMNANHRLEQLIRALECNDWFSAYQLCFQEFMEMHDLFHTASPSFSYFTSEIQFVLKKLQDFWVEYQTGPLITMDAGPNIHLLYAFEQKEVATALMLDLSKEYHVLSF